jgi:hypothetical protein
MKKNCVFLKKNEKKSSISSKLCILLLLCPIMIQKIIQFYTSDDLQVSKVSAQIFMPASRSNLIAFACFARAKKPGGGGVKRP